METGKKEKLSQLPEKWKKRAVLGYSLLRSLHFSGQFLTIPLIEQLTTGGQKKPPEALPEKLKWAFQDMLSLLERDAQNIAENIYPLEVLRPENPGRHVLRLSRILLDGVQISKRRADKSAHDFSKADLEKLDEIPKYAQRNFHFQTGGYVSSDSAELYEHQVEILFSGSADAMRRLIIAPLKKQLKTNDGEGLHFLEVGAGTGRLTRFMKLAFPKAKITASDMSASYLKKARQQLKDFERVDFVQACAESLPFQDKSFDLVYSCFLFHELPRDIRIQALKESVRVLKDSGFIGALDSIQKVDSPQLDWALQLFPQDFHEPFYKNYQMHPLEDIFEQQGLQVLERQTGFFSKALVSQKSSSKPLKSRSKKA